MKEIIVTNTISVNQISIGLNLNDGNAQIPTITIDITGDVDLNRLINEIIKLLELNRKFSVNYSDLDSLSETNGKIKLIKNTLDEIYAKFNEKVGNVTKDNVTI